MIQFTVEEIERIRKRAVACPMVTQKLKQSLEVLQNGSLKVPKEGNGNWTLYYYCPDCSVQLIFDRENPDHHWCPVCGRDCRGEPYHGAWWGFVHMENYNGAFELGILYLLTGDHSYGRKAVELMLEYAKYYVGYKVHGDIPYNGPGKACAQTLDEAVLLRTFAMAYDLTEKVMEEQERDRIQQYLLIPGAEFLLNHRHKQLHNHEVIINSAIAVIGLLSEKEEYIRQAVYEPYGLLDQLERGMLPSGMWFEGSFGYHFYALTSFFAYEKFALHTKHSHIKHPNYRKMMEVLIHYLQPDNRIPMLNDTTCEHGVSNLYLYEFAYRELKSPVIKSLLNRLYENQNRDHVEALLYGAEKLEPCKLELSDFHTAVGGSGHTILRGKDDRFLLFKHDTYGGEHDHYDRLDISYLAYGKKIAADLGTTGYGAVLHYNYYKNTGSHNTVVIGEENQPPAACTLVRYEMVNGITYVEAVCDWSAPYAMPDSFTIVQWKAENYKQVKMTRKIAWAENWFAEMFLVEGVDEKLTTDWVMHIGGSRQTGVGEEEQTELFSEKQPYCYLKKVVKESGWGQTAEHFTDGEVLTDLYSYVPEGEVFVAKGPDNPSCSDINYRIERRRSGESLYAHVIETYRNKKTIEQVVFHEPVSESKAPEYRTLIEVRDINGIHKIKF